MACSLCGVMSWVVQLTQSRHAHKHLLDCTGASVLHKWATQPEALHRQRLRAYKRRGDILLVVDVLALANVSVRTHRHVRDWLGHVPPDSQVLHQQRRSHRRWCSCSA